MTTWEEWRTFKKLKCACILRSCGFLNYFSLAGKYIVLTSSSLGLGPNRDTCKYFFSRGLW